MRNQNVVKYRKLLYELQHFCSCMKKEIVWTGTDFERGICEGKHETYNEILRKLQGMVEQAESDWENIKVREENCD